jgi:hypothetical protein
MGSDGQNIYFLHRVPRGYEEFRRPNGRIKISTQLSEITFNYEMRENRESAWLAFSRLARIS